MLDKIKNNFGYVLLAGILAISFHLAMKADAENLCSSDATAYAECSK